MAQDLSILVSSSGQKYFVLFLCLASYCSHLRYMGKLNRFFFAPKPCREIDNPMNVPSVVVDKNLLDFCSPVCLFAFNCQEKTDPPGPELPFCSICKKSNEVKTSSKHPHQHTLPSQHKPALTPLFLIQVLHEVIYHGEVHKLCSDYCFFTWRCNRNLAINFCESCGMYCSSKGSGCQNLIIGDVNLRFCSPTCISTYKQVVMRLQRSRRQISEWL